MQSNEEKRDELIKTIKDLVSFKTTEKNFSEFERTVNYVKNFFASSNVTIFEHRFEGHPALVISTKGKKHSHIMLQGHLDVVNGKEEQFTPKILGNKLFGRGTVDMKGFVALAMHALRELSSEDLDLSLMITFDEEVGSQNGVSKLADEYSCDILFNGDGGYNYAVIYGEKGILKVKLTVKTNPGRHPYPWDGENAFEVFTEDYNRIKDLFPESKLATDNDNWHTTYSIYDIKAENKEFYPPHYLEAKMNFYFVDELSVQDLYYKIESVLQRTKMEILTGSERVFLDPSSPHVLSLKEIMERNFGREIILRTENGSSDARFYANKGIPIVIVKMPGEDHHGENEHLYIDGVLPLYNSVVDFISENSKLNLVEINESKHHE